MSRVLSLLLPFFLCVVASGQDTETPIEELEQGLPEASTTDLQAAAAEFMAAVQTANENVEQLEAELGDVAEAEKADAQTALGNAQEALDDLTARMQLYVNELDEREVDVTELKVFLTQETGEVSLDNIDAEVAADLIQGWISGAREAVVEQGPGWIFKAFMFLGTVFVFWLLSKVVGRVVRRAMGLSKLNVSELLRDFTVKMSVKGTIAVGVLVALASTGFQVGPVLAGLGDDPGPTPWRKTAFA